MKMIALNIYRTDHLHFAWGQYKWPDQRVMQPPLALDSCKIIKLALGHPKVYIGLMISVLLFSYLFTCLQRCLFDI